jgi:hypothetical protein
MAAQTVNEISPGDGKMPARSPAARRMRSYRHRRRQGVRCVCLKIPSAEIEALIARNRLSRGNREDPDGIAFAIYDLLADLLSD